MKKSIILIQAVMLAILPSLSLKADDNNSNNEQRPNILFILSDDHSSQAWGKVYGGILEKYTKTTNIEKLASQGAVLENAFNTNSLSGASHASIYTGAYSHINEVKVVDDALYPEQDNIAKEIQKSGYQTAVIGKWYLNEEPSGFDHYFVMNKEGDEYIDPIFQTKENWSKKKLGQGEKIVGFSTDIITDKTIEWIKNRDKDKPFLMFTQFKATSEPFDFPVRLEEIYDGVVFPEPDNMLEFGRTASGRTFDGLNLEELAYRWEEASKDTEAWHMFYPELPFRTNGLDSVSARKKTYQKLVRDYLRSAATIDENIGKLMASLDENGLAENTIVIYVSDQGYFLGEHGFMDKRLMYEESLRMPFIIRYPKEITAGTRNKDIILNIDFAALLADYAQAELPDLSQGKSFRENLKGNTPSDWRKSMYYRYWTQHEIRPAHMGIRNSDYKLIFFYGYRNGIKKKSAPSWELYDLRLDPKENKNVYNTPKYAPIVESMKAEMLELRKSLRDTDEDKDKFMKGLMDQYYWQKPKYE